MYACLHGFHIHILVCIIDKKNKNKNCENLDARTVWVFNSYANKIKEGHRHNAACLEAINNNKTK